LQYKHNNKVLYLYDQGSFQLSRKYSTFQWVLKKLKPGLQCNVTQFFFAEQPNPTPLKKAERKVERERRVVVVVCLCLCERERDRGERPER